MFITNPIHFKINQLILTFESSSISNIIHHPTLLISLTITFNFQYRQRSLLIYYIEMHEISSWFEFRSCIIEIGAEGWRMVMKMGSRYIIHSIIQLTGIHINSTLLTSSPSLWQCWIKNSSLTFAPAPRRPFALRSARPRICSQHFPINIPAWIFHCLSLGVRLSLLIDMANSNLLLTYEYSTPNRIGIL